VQYRLGRECNILVEGLLLKGVRDVRPKRKTREQDATAYNHSCESTVVTHRTWELEVDVVDDDDAKVLRAVEESDGLVSVQLQNGLRQLTANFTVCESSADEPIDGAVVATFVLKQWGHSR